MRKRLFSILLVLVMCASLFPIADTPARAIGNYGVNLESDAYQSSINPFVGKDLKGQCTWYCWGRAYEKTGTELWWGNGRFGNAISWYDNASAGYNCDKIATGNSILVSPDGKYWDDDLGRWVQCGHVMFVEKVENGYAYITESNWPSAGAYHEDVINLSNGKRNWGNGSPVNITGYIHVAQAAATIPEGIYYFRSALDNNLVVSVANESKEWGGNIRLEQYRGTASQRFKVCAFEGCYTIVNMNSQLSVDVSGESSEPGANVQQYKYWPSETKAQQWYFEDSGDGYYYIRSALGTYLDVLDGVTADGQNIQTYVWNRSAAQKFKLDMSSPSINSVSIDEGVYYLHSALDDNLVIGVKNASTDSGANIELERYMGTSSQQFIVNSFNGNYTIINDNSQLSLDVSGASNESGINVQQYHCWPSETKAQQWCFEDAGDGYYYIRSALGTYLDVLDGVTAAGQNIQTYIWNGSAAQKFRLEQNRRCTRIINLTKTASAVEVEIACFDTEALLFCAAYTENGKMLGIECKPVAKGQQKYVFTLFSGNQVEAFLLDSKFRPLCEGVMITEKVRLIRETVSN